MIGVWDVLDYLDFTFAFFTMLVVIVSFSMEHRSDSSFQMSEVMESCRGVLISVLGFRFSFLLKGVDTAQGLITPCNF